MISSPFRMPGLASEQAQSHKPSLNMTLFFVLLWPTLNLLFVTAVMNEQGVASYAVMGSAALRLYLLFGLVYVVILLVKRAAPRIFASGRFLPEWLLHLVVFLLIAQLLGQFFSPLLERANNAGIPQSRVAPLVLMTFQVTLFVAAKTILLQRERHLVTELTLRQAKINLLRSQSNPHFLFNTLNLLASEIPRHPETAREIVYDLADLLRDSMRATEQAMVPVSEEVRLVELYLGLQKKRFAERFAFSIQVADECAAIQLPPLLLQPLVENVIKHVVATSSRQTTLDLTVARDKDQLVISIRDNGPALTSRVL